MRTESYQSYLSLYQSSWNGTCYKTDAQYFTIEWMNSKLRLTKIL